MHPVRKVSAHMTAAPHAIEADAPLAQAQQRMRALGLAHLAVVCSGRPYAVLRERDLQLAVRLGADLLATTLRMLLPRDGLGFSVTADESLACAVRAMASRAADSAIVTRDGVPCGLLTTPDVLHAAAEILEADRAEQQRDESPCSLLEEGCLIARVEELAKAIAASASADDASIHALRTATKELHEGQLAHLAADERALIATPDDGSLRRRNLELRRRERLQHVQQLEGLLMSLDDLAQPASAIAAGALAAVESLRAETERERDPLAFVS